MQYKVVFDITQTGFHQWSDLVTCFIFIPFAIGMFWFHQRGVKHVGWRPFVYLVFLALFLCVWSFFPLFMFVGTYRNYSNIKSAMQQSQCEIAEGIVTQFHHSAASKDVEAFFVNGIQFRYGGSSRQNGFHQIGIIHDGLQVRIYHYDKDDSIDKDIARLEVAQ